MVHMQPCLIQRHMHNRILCISKPRQLSAIPNQVGVCVVLLHVSEMVPKRYTRGITVRRAPLAL